MLVGGIDRIGGTELQAAQLARALMKRGVQVQFVSSVRQPKALPEHLAVLKLHVIARPFFERLPQGVAGGAYVAAMLALLLRWSATYDILHAHHLSPPGVLASLAGKLTRKPALAKVAGIHERGDLATVRNSPFSEVQTGLLQQLRYIVATTEEIRRHLLASGFAAHRIVRCPNGVDTNRFVPVSATQKTRLRQELGLPGDKVLAIYVGSLRTVKGPDLLVEAWRLLPRNLAGLLIVGSGPLEQRLRAKASELSIAHELSFVGTSHQVERYLQSADVFVLPSRSEGQSNALLEAMSTGLAVIVSDIPANREVVGSVDTAMLFESGNPESLADRLQDLLTDAVQRRRLAKAARERVEQQFDLDTVAQRYIELYQDCLSSKSMYAKGQLG